MTIARGATLAAVALVVAAACGASQRNTTSTIADTATITRADTTTDVERETTAPPESTGPEPTGPQPTGPEPTTTNQPTTTTQPRPPADTTRLVQVDRVTGDLQPKSVVASGTGLVIAQNMMYRHSISVFGADRALRATIDDSVDLTAFGIDGHPGISRGAPVEAAFTSDGRYAYVSNYSMYGNGFGPEGDDDCEPDDGYDDSFVYRIDTTTFAIDQVIAVGSVPKFVAVTPDDRLTLVTNWCTFDLSIIDNATAREVQRIPMGRHPRGIVVTPDSQRAFIAVMGGGAIKAVDLSTFAVSDFVAPGAGPRHIVISPDGATLYVTLNTAGRVARIDVASASITHTVATGTHPRSMAISPDGRALYVVNYDSSTMTKLAAADLAEIQSVDTDYHPIGITYEPTTATVWVACYGGSILIYADDRTP